MAYLEAEKSQRTFKLNNKASVTIKSEMKGDVYSHQVVLTVTAATMGPLQFVSKTELAKLLQEADLEDENLSLFGPDDAKV